jgi:transporter family protein
VGHLSEALRHIVRSLHVILDNQNLQSIHLILMDRIVSFRHNRQSAKLFATIEAMKDSQSWLLFALGSAFFAGLTAILGKIGVAGINSNLATLIRTVVILLFAAAIVAARGEWHGLSAVTAKTAGFLVLSGLATGCSWLLYFRALQLAPASKVAPIDKLSVVIAIALGIVLLGEPLSPKLIAGGLLIVAGTVLIATI